MKRTHMVRNLFFNIIIMSTLFPSPIVKGEPQKTNILTTAYTIITPEKVNFIIDKMYTVGDEISLEYLLSNNTSKDVNSVDKVALKVLDNKKQVFLDANFLKLTLNTPIKPNTMVRGKLRFPKGTYNMENIDLSNYSFEFHAIMK